MRDSINFPFKSLFYSVALSALLATTQVYSSGDKPMEMETKKLPEIQTMVRDGVSIEFTVIPDDNQSVVVEGNYADVEFRIKDTQTGEPVKGIYPAVWLDIARPWNQPDLKTEVTCKDRVQLYMQGIVGVRPLVDLNSYFVLVLNQDATISVIDPIIGVGGITKLYAVINLIAPGADWTKTYDEKYMFVSMSSKDQVALVDLTTFKVVDNLDAGANPVRLSLQPDEKYLWVSNNHRDAEKSGVTIIDVATREKVKFIATGSGHHELAFSHDSRYAYISNRDHASVDVIEVASLKKINSINAGKQIIDIAYSKMSEALYVSDGETGRVAVIDNNSHIIKKYIQLKTGIGPVGVSQDGRWMIAVNTILDEVYAIDVATNELAHTVAVGRKPYQVMFSHAFAYIRALGTERVSMIELNHLNSGHKVTASSFAAGSNAPGKVRDLSLASAVSEAPGEAAVLVVSPSDNTVYYYMEGMNAPMGNFRNYGHPPRAVQVADRTLREEKDGVYHAKVRIPAAGTYDVAFLMESPSILHCFSMMAERDPDLKIHLTAGVDFIDTPQKVALGDEVKIRFKLTDPESGAIKTNLNDVRVRYYRAPAFDRREEFASDMGEGIYEIDAKLNKKGVYYFYVSSKSSNVDFGESQFHSIQVTPAVPARN